jgi:hypothetical protein
VGGRQITVAWKMLAWNWSSMTASCQRRREIANDRS